MLNNENYGLPRSKKLAQGTQFNGVRRLFWRQDSTHEKLSWHRAVKKVIHEGSLRSYPKTLWIIVLINTDFALSLTITEPCATFTHWALRLLLDLREWRSCRWLERHSRLLKSVNQSQYIRGWQLVRLAQPNQQSPLDKISASVNWSAHNTAHHR